jgi:esterase/lipase superfamily enzyme
MLVLPAILAGCTTGPYRIDLMPAPEAYGEDELTPFTDHTPLADAVHPGMLYATDREPLAADAPPGSRERFYANDRGHLVRLGVAEVQLGEGELTWEEARRISLAKNRTDRYPLQVRDVREFGILDRSLHELEPADVRAAASPGPARRFAEAVNARLARSTVKDVFVYVHGYLVVFDNPVLVASELWHFLGYEGAFVAYAWPSTPKRLAYFSDAETTATSARHLRVFLEYLAEETNAERIHILGYSQGTRLVGETIHSMALMHHDEPAETVREKLRIGRVMLVGSDIEQELFATYLVDGLLRVPEQLTVYVSEKDSALTFSRRLLGRGRLGEALDPSQMQPHVVEFLERTPRVTVINVTQAAGATSGRGHDYFRSSPWVSSDILATLRYDLPPAERGLVRAPGSPVWGFPEDYVERLREALRSHAPGPVGDGRSHPASSDTGPQTDAGGL